jgi:hypothetical protein
MKFILHTLIDITETGERKGPNKIAIGQQSNCDSVIAAIGLRANPELIMLKEQEESISKLGFGKSFTGKHKYWTLEFNMPEASTSVELLQKDFDLVPIVTDLNETAKINISVFQTYDTANKNIVFILADND